MKRVKIIYLILCFGIISCNSPLKTDRESINLAGKWQFAIDSSKVGMEKLWYLTTLTDSVDLPGTTDTNHKGYLNKDTTTIHLNRVYKYEGVAWYRKKVVIPASFKNKHIQLFLERTKSTTIWIDSIRIGSSNILLTPQQFNATEYLNPGEHYITIKVDNSLKLTPYGNVHIYSDDTQTNWNGIIGKIYIEATSKTYISAIRVSPNVDKKEINVKIAVSNGLNLKDVAVTLKIKKTVTGKTTELKSYTTKQPCEPEINLTYKLENECSLWDEYEQPLYTLTAEISNGEISDSKSVPFGMRKFTVKGKQFAINGRTTFLRGKHDAAVFPLTGYPPIDVEGWTRVFKIAKLYGINHYRFHSYCPPEAAFTAADQEGIYLQAELPFWGGLDSDTIADMLLKEGYALLDAYANHPSFVMFSHGNEIWGGHDRVEKNILALKKYDPRPLYTMGSNNNIGFVAPRACSDFFIGARTPFDHDSILTHTRLAQCFADSKNGGILNTQTPSTEIKFDYAVSHIDIPIVSHEIGQYQIYPDYKEIDKYTGVLRAWNLEVFRNHLAKSGMLQMDSIFHQASGAWSVICYKAEMEAALRTNGLAGFQLLDLQDFPGQGTALVGILDAFMDSKNVTTPQFWKQSCNDVVLLLEFPHYCLTNNEIFKAKVVVTNYSNSIIKKELNWKIKKQDGQVIKQGTINDLHSAIGGLTSAGEISADLSSVSDAEKLTIDISLSDTEYNNTYPLWVYPTKRNVEIPSDILVKDKLNQQVIAQLESGAKVLLFPQPEDIQNNSYSGLFPPEFWNWGMFKGISEWLKKPVSPGTLGILTNPSHPVFNSFPTDFHTNWQWFSIIKSSHALILDSTPSNYRPIVQVIDNLERNHKLGLIFEFKIGRGKLLVCMSQLNKLTHTPEATQLYKSIVNYMESNDFNPGCSLTVDELKKIFSN